MKFLIKKICTLIMTLFLVSVAAFLAFQVIPGDVVRSILGTEATPEREAQLREELGLDKPPVERYISWADDVLHGDFGVSYRYSKNMNEMMPVKELIGDKLPVTLYLAVISFVMIVLVSIPLGVLWAKCGSRFLDAVFGVLTQVTMAVPSFFLGILVTYLCGIVLKWFVPGGYISYQENISASASSFPISWFSKKRLYLIFISFIITMAGSARPWQKVLLSQTPVQIPTRSLPNMAWSM